MARRVVLATGRDGLGGPALPAFVPALPRERWAHSSDVLDFATLAGRRVGVVGAGSSAMDCAATALEAGCAGVDFLIRRADLPRVNKGKGAGNPGLTHGHYLLSDAQRWRVRHYINAVAVPPPRGSTLRVSSHGERVRFHFNAPVQRIAFADGALRVDTPQGRFTLDFLFVATGFVIDWRQRPELAAIAPHVRTWQDRFTPPAGMAGDRELRDSPDLGPAFEFQEKQAGTCPGLDHIHNFNYPAALSHGTVSGDIPAISTGAARLAQGIASLLYAEDFEQHYAAMVDYAEPELLGDEWVPAPAGGGGYSEH